MNEIAKESGHFYYPDGTSAYEIVGKNGKLRPTTLRDAKKLGLLPSVTSILSVYPKPFLEVWKKKQVLMSALTLTRLPNETDDVYIARIMADAGEQARVAREKGTAIHGAIEKALLGILPKTTEYNVYVQAAFRAITEYFAGANWMQSVEAEKSFANTEYGYGGKIDLHSRELNFVADFKTKEFDEGTKKLAYDEQIIQLEAYAKGLGMPDARLINVYVSTSVPGLVRIVEHEPDERYWQMFLTCLRLWQLTKNVAGVAVDAL